jgi:outer membrane murein-binding lipoprotein Lpp
MRYLILVLLVLSGCTSEDKEKDRTIHSLREKLDSAYETLTACQARLEVYSKQIFR